MLGIQHLKERNDPVMDAILVDIERMLGQGESDVPLNLCFATVRGDDALLLKLLNQGMDPNELDSTGRTPLVCTFHLIKSTLIYICIYIHMMNIDVEAQDFFFFFNYFFAVLYATAYRSIKRKYGLSGSTPRSWSKSQQ